MASFLEQHFDQWLDVDEEEALTSQKPNYSAQQAPLLDGLVKEQLRMKENVPLQIRGFRTVWHYNLFNSDTEVSTGKVLILIQTAIVLLGHTSHRCSRTKLKQHLASEDFPGRKTDLFGPCFLEKAIESENQGRSF